MQFDPHTAAAGGIDPLRRPMRLRIHLALGGTRGGPVDDSRRPARFDIAAVRIWSWQPGQDDAIEPPVQPVSPAPELPPPPTPRWGR